MKQLWACLHIYIHEEKRPQITKGNEKQITVLVSYQLVVGHQISRVTIPGCKYHYFSSCLPGKKWWLIFLFSIYWVIDFMLLFGLICEALFPLQINVISRIANKILDRVGDKYDFHSLVINTTVSWFLLDFIQGALNKNKTVSIRDDSIFLF